MKLQEKLLKMFSNRKFKFFLQLIHLSNSYQLFMVSDEKSINCLL